MSAPSERPVLFHYAASIYSHRVLWYLWLRGVPYDECIQPPVMPRPDLAAIGIGYRKIPIVAIGKDIYCDSRLIISKLEALYPDNALAPQTAADAGVRKLLESWNIDGGIFSNTVKLMPYWLDNGLLQNQAFLDDRQTLMGGKRMTAATMERGRPDGLQHMRQAFDMLETTFLADDRNWILNTKEPSVADIDAVWPFEWLIVDKGMRGSLPKEQFDAQTYPKVYAWVDRFMAYVKEKKRLIAPPTAVNGASLRERQLGASAACEPVAFDSNDPLKLAEGEKVDVYPSDYGNMGKTTGSVIGLTTNEVVLENEHGLHVHFPRWNFHIKKVATSPSIPRAIIPSPRLPKLQLIYHPFSPYSRKVFAFAHELDLARHIALQKVVVCPVPIAGWSDNNAYVAVYNPMAKIPCLISEDVPDGIFDSRVICEYLGQLRTTKVGQGARHWQLRTLHAAADGLMDAAVLITYEVRIRKQNGTYFTEWVEGQKQKIVRVLDKFDAAAKDGVLGDPRNSPATADEVAVAVAVAATEQMGFLEIAWAKNRDNLVQWMKHWEQRESFIRTPPTHDWASDTEGLATSKM